MQAVTREQEVEAIKSTLSKVRNDIGQLAEEVVELGKSETKDARSKLEAKVKQRLEVLQNELAEGRERSINFETIRSRVKERPLASLFTALGLGYVVGRVGGLFERRHD